MKTMKRWLIGGSLLLAVAAAGGAYATIPSGGVINGCYQKNVGMLRVIDAATDSCRPSEEPLTWNVQGPKGNKGDKGDTGEQGPAGPQGPQGPAGESTRYTAGVGLELLEIPPPFEAHAFSIAQGHRLPQQCPAGAVPQKAGAGPGWVCGDSSTGASQAYRAEGVADLPVQGDFLVASLPLPAGHYVISARADLLTSDLDEQPAHCTLSTGDRSQTWLHQGGEPVTQPISLQDLASFAVPTTVELRCGTYQGGASGFIIVTSVGAIN